MQVISSSFERTSNSTLKYAIGTNKSKYLSKQYSINEHMEVRHKYSTYQALRFLYITLEPTDMVEIVFGQLVRELLQHVPKYNRINVLAQHVEQEPVAHLAPTHQQVNGVLSHEPEAHAQQVHAHARREYDYDPVNDRHERQASEDDEPEPEEHVDLLVDDVEGQDADGVVALDFAGDAVFVEGALGHSREDEDHGVDAVLLVAVQEVDHLDAEGEEGAVEELVHHKHLS